jgi:transposase
VVTADGVPLAAIVTGANRHDSTQLIPLVDAIPPVRGKRGAPLRKPGCVVADRGYDYDCHRLTLSCRAIRTHIARRGTPHGSGLGVWRWPVERTISWLHQFRRLRIRWERRVDIHAAFLRLGCAIICWRMLHLPVC